MRLFMNTGSMRRLFFETLERLVHELQRLGVVKS